MRLRHSIKNSPQMLKTHYLLPVKSPIFVLVICYQKDSLGFAVKMMPTGYFFQNCHGFFVGTGTTGSGVVGSLDSINSIA